MSRRYDDPVEVRRQDDQPVAFLWRGRLWTVRAVLASWVQTGAWWQAAVPDGPAPVRGARSTGSTGAATGAVAGSAAAGEAAGPAVADPTTGAPLGAVALAAERLAAERELWRVEATRGRVHGTGVFDLCFDWSSGDWTLVAALD